jgi:phage baseplate assembly protein gpV
MVPRDVFELVKELQETLYLRHYGGKVVSNSDPLKEGRVKAQVPMLGWSTDATAAWCRPRDKHSMVVPSVGEWVEVYFVDGDRSRPAYSGVACEMKDALPKDFDGEATTAVLFQDAGTGDSLVYDATTGEVKIIGSGDNLVTYSALAQAINALANVFNAHTHLYIPGTLPPVPSAAPATSMSGDISGAKASHLKTDG